MTDQKQITIIESMTLNEARQYVARIRSTAEEMGKLLNELKKREGWKALGYRTWTECMEKEFPHSRKHLYELMKAAPVIEAIGELPAGNNKLSSGQAAVVAQYPEELWPAIVSMTASRYDSITESRLERVGETLLQASRTGGVNVGDGSITVAVDEQIDLERTGLSLALDLEDEEARKRQWEYMNQGVKHISFKTISELASRLLKTLDAVQFEELLKLLNPTVRAEYS
jgi:hypothetical protein